jgi:hypothetical protein
MSTAVDDDAAKYTQIGTDVVEALCGDVRQWISATFDNPGVVLVKEFAAQVTDLRSIPALEAATSDFRQYLLTLFEGFADAAMSDMKTPLKEIFEKMDMGEHYENLVRLEVRSYQDFVWSKCLEIRDIQLADIDRFLSGLRATAAPLFRQLFEQDARTTKLPDAP